MRGMRIADVSRRFFREATFGLIVAPAIADMQSECADGSAATILQSYAGVARAISGAVLWDLRTDLGLLYEDALDLLRILAMQVCYYGAMATMVGGAAFGGLSRGDLAVIASIVVSFALIPTLICFWPERFTDPAGID